MCCCGQGTKGLNGRASKSKSSESLCMIGRSPRSDLRASLFQVGVGAGDGGVAYRDAVIGTVRYHEDASRGPYEHGRM